MGNITIGKDVVIVEEEKPVTYVGCIIKGSVEAYNEHTKIKLYVGDVIGINDIMRGTHSFTYQAKEESVMVTYALEGNALQKLLEENATMAKCILTSSIRQMYAVLEFYQHRMNECEDLHRLLSGSYTDYKNMCKLLLIPVKMLPQLISDSGEEEMIPVFEREEMVDGHIRQYYTEMQDMNKRHILENLAAYPLFSMDILYKAGEEFSNVLQEIGRLRDYETELAVLLMNENSLDFFDIFTSLYYHYIKKSGNNPFVASKLADLEEKIKNSAVIDPSVWEQRIASHHEKVDRLLEERENGIMGEKGDTTAYYKEIVNSLGIILEYASCGSEVEAEFKKLVNDYKKVIDKNSSDKGVRALRQRLTELFYEVYTSALKKSLSDPEVPVVLKMFFNFGYVDEELAGIENAVCLYSIADRYNGQPEKQIYTAYEWFMAIYQGIKQPRRNEFDVDYQTYVHEKVVNRSITKKEEKNLLEDDEERLKYELANFFPSVNKMTFGRISTFCPVFSESNVIADLNDALVVPSKVMAILQEIRDIDYSAFYREELFFDSVTNTREFIQKEYLPDIILMPNVGSRGVMWQEIEGKHRSSNATYVLPIFLLESMEKTIIRMTGEYRFEMCKRIQGARWNDVSDPSLTSEYCDYIQFYRKNNELSASNKEQVKTALLKARNSYKQMFAGDYLSWIMFEGKGAPRLNKVARRIVFKYCPFKKEMRDSLLDNPLYRDIIAHYEIKKTQAVTRFRNLIRKLEGSGKEVPEELYRQQEFLEM